MPYVIEMTTTTGAALFGYGATESRAWADARRQISGYYRASQGLMLRRMTSRCVSDDLASEIEEMLAADVIGWTDTGRTA